MTIRLFGDLQAREISNHVRMYEYRAFFERVQIQGERSLKELFRDFPGYENAFSAFTQCQGFVVSSFSCSTRNFFYSSIPVRNT